MNLDTIHMMIRNYNSKSRSFNASDIDEEMHNCLAQVVVFGYEPSGNENTECLRQIGYAADLARNRVDDPNRNLEALAVKCRDILSRISPREQKSLDFDPDIPPQRQKYRDPIQALWGGRMEYGSAGNKIQSSGSYQVSCQIRIGQSDNRTLKIRRIFFGKLFRMKFSGQFIAANITKH